LSEICGATPAVPAAAMIGMLFVAAPVSSTRKLPAMEPMVSDSAADPGPGSFDGAGDGAMAGESICGGSGTTTVCVDDQLSLQTDSTLQPLTL
jgi:hypothetical protein